MKLQCLILCNDWKEEEGGGGGGGGHHRQLAVVSVSSGSVVEWKGQSAIMGVDWGAGNALQDLCPLLRDTSFNLQWHA